MVLYKRKPVTLIPHPPIVNDAAEVWVVDATGEVFTEYEKYLKRFVPSVVTIDAHSNISPDTTIFIRQAAHDKIPRLARLTLKQKKFTDAVNGKSGLTYADAIASENHSAEAIDDIFPRKLREPILRKVQFSTTSRMDELVNIIYDEFKHEYFPGEHVIVTLDNSEAMPGLIREKARFPQIKGPDGQIQRHAFSRYFVRIEEINAEEAILDSKHLRRDRKVFTKLNLRAFLKKSLAREAWNGAPWLVNENLALRYRLPMEIPHHLMKEAQSLLKSQQTHLPKPRQRRSIKNMTPEEQHQFRLEQQARGRQPNGHGPHPHGPQHAGPPPGYMLPSMPVRPPPPPVIKYPIEDTDISPKNNGVVRPPLKALPEIDMSTVGALLEVWNTLNVQAEVYVLDSFTFDDFVAAMRFQHADIKCELLEEMFCAVLKQLVTAQGTIEAELLRSLVLNEDETPDESTEATPNESKASTPAVDDVPARSTRSRLSQVENAQQATPEPLIPHKAKEVLQGFDWKSALALREVEDGGWQMILLAVLYQLSRVPSQSESCDRVLAFLAPLDEPISEDPKELVRTRFVHMEVGLRIAALQAITLLSVTTKTLKKFLEQCSEDQTDVRKKKLELQRERKTAIEELTNKERERSALAPITLPPSPTVEIPADADTVMDTTEGSIAPNGAGSSEPEEDAPTANRSLRRSNNDRKRKRDEETARRNAEEQKRKQAAALEEKKKKQYAALVRDCELLKERIMDLEARIADCDDDLREADVQRTKLLGKDRFCNRYYWFERNGQPFGGLPSSSTSTRGYANGRIWVQGPDDLEREGFIDLPKDLQAVYRAHWGMTVPERRKQEEGLTSLADAHEWGFYETPDELDSLIGWLDDRGEREKKLRREFFEWREKITTYMRAYKSYNDNEAARRLEAEEEPKKGIATRRQTQESEITAKERCMDWRNTMVMDEQKRLHSVNPVKKPTRKEAAAAAKAAAPSAMIGRSGKPLTRQ
ncbi:hypothetical protein B0A48_16257 [Cryoendolithus antarcticus]|uniref:WAC domain-containing protein n=1 Tax=Cryoendolithus antarcticus TaxID=1507870 RepID=A0A1V8SFL5_9PEZI|nr:hypothetical protein B0A48_16257 [Cryoendolithus antarcticus]